jgi:hypothetical protein
MALTIEIGSRMSCDNAEYISVSRPPNILVSFTVAQTHIKFPEAFCSWNGWNECLDLHEQVEFNVGPDQSYKHPFELADECKLCSLNTS